VLKRAIAVVAHSSNPLFRARRYVRRIGELHHFDHLHAVVEKLNIALHRQHS
jgi:hypothetical protein